MSVRKSAKSTGYQSPLSKLYKRQQPKVKAKQGMARLLLAYAENDPKRIALLIQKWMSDAD